MGSLFGSSSTTTTSGDPVKQQAWAVAQPYYQQGLQGASNLYSSVKANPAYSGDRVADLNPYQTSGANYLGNFASGFTPTAANAAGNLGLSNVLASMGYGSNAQNIYNRASGDPTSQIIGQAGAYADNPYVNGLIDSAGRDVTRNLFEQQLPGIDRAATGTGNLNSTRAGVESAIATRGAADRLADISSGIRSQFFGKGLDMAQSQYNQNLQNMLASNSGLYNAANLGLTGLQGAQGLASTGAGQSITAGDLFQNQAQNELSANKSYYDESLANQLATINALLGGQATGGAWSGGAQSQTTTSSGSPISSIGGTLMGLGSLGWKPFSDERMKQNIVKIGKLESGIPIYKYEFKPEFKDIAGHGQFIGVMAQELEKVIPDAVSMASNGYKMVDYSKVR